MISETRIKKLIRRLLQAAALAFPIAIGALTILLLYLH